jgi:hypothetical protein
MVKLDISDDLADRIESRVEMTDFQDKDDYAEFVLSEVLTCVERETREDHVSNDSREDVRERLESLGYLQE